MVKFVLYCYVVERAPAEGVPEHSHDGCHRSVAPQGARMMDQRLSSAKSMPDAKIRDLKRLMRLESM